jgi:hypothetical protein
MNPAAYGMAVCRFHGARKKKTILSGKDHFNYKHGGCTLEARVKQKKARLRLKELVSIMKRLKMLD